MLNTLTTPELAQIKDNVVFQLAEKGHSEEKHPVKIGRDGSQILDIMHNLVHFACVFSFETDGTTLENRSVILLTKDGKLVYEEDKAYPNDTREAFIQRWTNEKYDCWPTHEQIQQVEKEHREDKKVKPFITLDTPEYRSATSSKLKARGWLELTPAEYFGLQPETHLNLSVLDKETIKYHFYKYVHAHNLNIYNCFVNFGMEGGTSIISYKLEDHGMMIFFDEFFENGRKLYNMTLLFDPYTWIDGSNTFLKRLNLRLKLNDILELFTDNGPMWDNIHPLA